VSSRDLDTPPRPVAAEPPPVGDPAPRRWSTGHTVAAAVVAVGVLASGGVAWAARDSTGTTSGPGGFGQQQPGGRGGFGQQPGQLPGPGQFGGPPQPPGQITQDDGGVHT
jgi:hypothetical protein